jgi:polysaccharide pyruvyl transferase WcaK-like protein
VIIEIKGVQFVNKGAELMLLAILQQVRILFPTAEVAMTPSPNAPYKERATHGALQIFPLQFHGFDFNPAVRLIPARIRRVLRNWFGIVFKQDVNLVLDASGFAYGDQWPHENIRYLVNDIQRCRRHNAKYIFLPQAFGPFTDHKFSSRLRQALPDAQLIFARDKVSESYLKDLGVPNAEIRNCPDFTNLVCAGHFKSALPEQEFLLVIPNFQMLHSRNPNKLWQTHYLQVIEGVGAIALQRGLAVVILNHEGTEDEQLCLLIADRLLKISSFVTIANETDALAVKGVIAKSRIVLSSRFHGCVSALSQGIPCMGTSWSHKYEELFKDYDSSDALLTPKCDAAELRNTFELLMSEQTKNHLLFRSSELKAQSIKMWHEIMSISNL